MAHPPCGVGDGRGAVRARGGSWMSTQSRGVSRRGVLAATGVAAFLAACSGGDKGSSGSTASQGGAATSAAGGQQAATPRKGGELILPQGDPGSQSLDPHITLNAAMFYWGLFSNLMAYADPKKLEPIRPGLVAKWEQPSKDTSRLTVQQGVKWHAKGKVTNGRALTAKDIAFNINRIYGAFDQQRLAQFQRRSNFAGMDKAEAVDDKVVKVTFTDPNSAFFN